MFPRRPSSLEGGADRFFPASNPVRPDIGGIRIPMQTPAGPARREKLCSMYPKYQFRTACPPISPKRNRPCISDGRHCICKGNAGQREACCRRRQNRKGKDAGTGQKKLAERGGFEPPNGNIPLTVFETAAFDRSAISPVFRKNVSVNITCKCGKSKRNTIKYRKRNGADRESGPTPIRNRLYRAEEARRFFAIGFHVFFRIFSIAA